MNNDVVITVPEHAETFIVSDQYGNNHREYNVKKNKKAPVECHAL